MGKVLYQAIIPLQPITKKNHQQIRKNFKTGKPYITQSDAYKQYEEDAGWFLRGGKNIQIPVNICMVFYYGSKRIVDLVGLEQACLDILVKYHVIQDDNARIAASYDGSCVQYDPKNPRTEIIITAKKEDDNYAKENA